MTDLTEASETTADKEFLELLLRLTNGAKEFVRDLLWDGKETATKIDDWARRTICETARAQSAWPVGLENLENQKDLALAACANIRRTIADFDRLAELWSSLCSGSDSRRIVASTLRDRLRDD